MLTINFQFVLSTLYATNQAFDVTIITLMRINAGQHSLYRYSPQYELIKSSLKHQNCSDFVMYIFVVIGVQLVYCR